MNFTVYSSQFTLISHCSFNQRKPLNAKSLKIANCKLLIATRGGV